MDRPGKALDVAATAQAAVNRLWSERESLAWLVIGAAFVNGLLDWLTNVPAIQANSEAWVYLLGALQVLVYTVLAVRLHRLVLGVTDPVQGVIRWSRRETRFLGWLLTVYFYLIVIFVAVASVAQFVSAFSSDLISGGWAFIGFMTLASLPAAYLFVRLSVLLPATAIDQKRNMAWAWSLTAGNGWRLVLMLWAVPMILSVLTPDLESVSLVGFMGLSLAVGALTALEIALLSIAFQVMGGLTELQEVVQGAE